MKHILLVDDLEMARQTLKLLLEHHGYACEEAEHGAAALAWLEQGPHVDLIVSDNHMPVMTGFEFLFRMNQFKSLAELARTGIAQTGSPVRNPATQAQPNLGEVARNR